MITPLVASLFFLKPPATAAAAFVRIKVLKENRSEACNVEKCKAFSSVATSLAHPTVQVVDPAVKRHSYGATVLGIPHGSDLFIQCELSAIIDKTELGLQELRKLAWYYREDFMQYI